MMTWEYRTLMMDSGDARSVDEQLSRLGKEHWELVAVVPSGSQIVAYLKRQTDFLFPKIGKGSEG